MYRTAHGQDAPLLITAFGSKVFAIDRARGEVVWKVQVDSTSDEVELAVGSGVVIAAARSKLAFIDYLTGRSLKVVERSGDYLRRATMLVDPPHIYIGGSGQVECYSMAGELLWIQGFKGEGLGSVALGVPGLVRQADGIGRE